MSERILAVFPDGKSQVFENKTEAYRTLHISWPDMTRMINTGCEYKPSRKHHHRKELVGMTMDIIIEDHGKD